MEYKCDLITDEIWERARAGETLPAETAEHLDACPKCRRAADEVQSVVSMVRVTASCVSPAPDCRSAVMGRIVPRRLWRSAWAYAAASVLLIAVIVSGWLAMHLGGKQPPVVVNDPKPEVRQEAPKPEVAPVVTPEAPKPKPAPVIEEKPRVEHPKRIHLVPKRPQTQLARRSEKQGQAGLDTPAVPEPREVVTFDDEPVAAVAVSWPSVGDQVMPASYGYTNRDVSSGEVTFCRVERSAGSINIRLESKAPGEMPGKGA